jgi:hypothetical protein
MSMCMCGSDGTFDSMGAGMIVGFDGTPIVTGGGRPDEIVTAEVRPDLVREARRVWGVENDIYQFGHRGYVAVRGGAQDGPYTYMQDLMAGQYRLPWEAEVQQRDGTSCGFAAPLRDYAGPATGGLPRPRAVKRLSPSGRPALRSLVRLGGVLLNRGVRAQHCGPAGAPAGTSEKSSMTEPKSPKPMPSAAVINAYLEESAARTRMRLPLAKGNAAVPPRANTAADAGAAAPDASAAGKTKTRELPLQGSKKLAPRAPAATPPAAAGEPAASGAAWRPFSTDDES